MPCFVYTCMFSVSVYSERGCAHAVSSSHNYRISSNTSRPRIVPASVRSLALNEITPGAIRAAQISAETATLIANETHVDDDPFASDEELEDGETVMSNDCFNTVLTALFYCTVV